MKPAVMQRWHGHLLSTLLAAALAMAAPFAWADSTIAPFVGVYVGQADVYDGSGVLVGKRDLEVVIEDVGRDRFRITWTNVSLVDGRRDVVGVERRVGEAIFEPGDRPQVYVQEMRGSLFEASRQMDFLAGDPMRWASVEGPRLGMYAIALTVDGLLEVQSYVRTLTEDGMDIEFQRVYDGGIERRILGRAIRVD